MNMFHASAHSRFARPLWLLLLGAALLLVAACAPAGTTNTAAQASSTATPTPAATTSPTTAQTGCPEANQDVNWPSAPGAVFTPNQSKSVSVNVGEAFEIALPMGFKWRMSPLSSSILKLDTPAGYGDTASHSCVWHFTTLSSGQAGIQYSMGPVCTKGMKCPAYLMLVDFNVQAS
jgi:hypothetical protein